MFLIMADHNSRVHDELLSLALSLHANQVPMRWSPAASDDR
jgi:hypothetical protein